MIKECLTKKEIITSYIIRKKVFIEEQKVSYEEEFDLEDLNYHNLLIYKNDIPVGTARYEVIHDYGHIGRLCILKDYRKQGLASKLINHIEKELKNKNIKKINIASQVKALDFYIKLGYKISSGIFLDANIEHMMVTKNL